MHSFFYVPMLGLEFREAMRYMCGGTHGFVACSNALKILLHIFFYALMFGLEFREAMWCVAWLFT